MVLMLGLKEINTVSNTDIYDLYKDLYLSQTKREEKLQRKKQTVQQ